MDELMEHRKNGSQRNLSQARLSEDISLTSSEDFYLAHPAPGFCDD
jgi:hypothetical protein